MDTISKFGARKTTCSKFHNNSSFNNSHNPFSNNRGDLENENKSNQMNIDISDVKISKIYLKEKDNFSTKNKHKTVMSTLFLKGAKEDFINVNNENVKNKGKMQNFNGESKTNLPIYKINNNYDRVNEILQLRSASTFNINSKKKMD